MNVLRTNITLPKTVLKHLRISVPQRQRSKFITLAIVEILGKKKTEEGALKISLQANASLYKREAEVWNAQKHRSGAAYEENRSPYCRKNERSRKGN